MTSSSAARGRLTRLLGIVTVAGLLPLLPSPALAAGTQTHAAPPTATAAPAATAGTAQARAAWRAALSRLPPPKEGCFTAVFPKTEWQKIPCTTNPLKPYPPGHGSHPNTVGGGGSGDFSAKLSSGHISAVEGSFDSINGVSAEIGNVGGMPPAQADTFSLQLNANTFTTPACAGATMVGCVGWQQFVYSNAGSLVMQYWLINYGASCPVGGNWFQTPLAPNDCYKNGVNQASPTPITITELNQLFLSATAASGGQDTVTLIDKGTAFTFSNPDSAVGLAQGWTEAEFNVFGDAYGSSAQFNNGSTIVVRTVVHNGTKDAPLCDQASFTGETNDLTLSGTAMIPIQPSPTIVFTQTNINGTAPGCAAAAGIGDTHLTTFSGLLYDFQASGDFLLAQAGANFVVQTRQASGAPTWPNAAVNKAVAVQMDGTRIAICLAPAQIVVGDRSREVGDGQTLALPGGVFLARHGNVYLVTGQSGNSLRAELMGQYINVNVGLGRWPQANVRGLLTNPGGKVDELAMRDGTVLKEPVSFAELYGRYGNSWRVPEGESLLSPCGKRVQSGNPEKPFYAKDLNPKLARPAQLVCKEAGVKEGPLLEACTLDVAVLGTKQAAGVFAAAAAPVAVAQAGLHPPP